MENQANNALRSEELERADNPYSSPQTGTDEQGELDSEISLPLIMSGPGVIAFSVGAAAMLNGPTMQPATRVGVIVVCGVVVLAAAMVVVRNVFQRE